MHHFLTFNDVMSNFDLLLDILLVLGMLCLQLVKFDFHVEVKLILLLLEKLLVDVDNLVQLYDFLRLLFDTISVSLSQIKIESGHVVDSLSIDDHLTLFFLKLADDSHEVLDDAFGQDFVLSVHHLHEIASIELHWFVEDTVCLLDSKLVKFWPVWIYSEVFHVLWSLDRHLKLDE